ncbi:MAG: AbrB/MazE/SpoVT family DNA-binding domain-containing protein [Candidatus Bathyarchaeia archaeon]
MVLEILIGRKGEIYTPKELRERLGLKPGDRLLAEVRGDQLILWKPLRLDEALSRKPKVEISLEEDLRLRGEISRRLGQAPP